MGPDPVHVWRVQSNQIVENSLFDENFSEKPSKIACQAPKAPNPIRNNNFPLAY
jgi:hypothetical protein